MTVNEVIKLIDKKDWDRAYNTNSNRFDAMFKAITDPRKLVGRSAAVYLIYTKLDRYLQYNIKHDITQYIEATGCSIKDLDTYDITTNSVLKTEPFYNEVLTKLSAIADQKAAEERAKEEARKVAESDGRVTEAIKIALSICAAKASRVMYSSSHWVSFGGRIGQHAHSWYRGSGTPIKSQSTVQDLLWKYDDGKHFINVYVPSGYDCEFGINYGSSSNYSMNVHRVAANNAAYDSDAIMSIYKLPKLTTKLKTEITTSVINKVTGLTEDEANKMFRIFD